MNEDFPEIAIGWYAPGYSFDRKKILIPYIGHMMVESYLEGAMKPEHWMKDKPFIDDRTAEVALTLYVFPHEWLHWFLHTWFDRETGIKYDNIAGELQYMLGPFSA